LSCPDCWPDYVKEKAGDIENRFKGYAEAKMQENAILIPGERKQISPRHIVFTVSPAHIAELAHRSIRAGYFNESFFLDKIREEYNQALKISGLLGGVSFYHDARVRHPETGADGAKAKMLIGREAKTAGIMEDDSAAWKMYQYINGLKNWREYYRFGPHFHALVFGQVLEISEFETKMPGWSYHNKGTVRETGGLAHYLLSHVAVINDRKAVTWFGRLSQKGMTKKESWIEYRTEICPVCGSPKVIGDSCRPGEVGREVTIKTIHYIWFFDSCGPPGGS
jgi:hypothetical protein